jgi:DedD protein
MDASLKQRLVGASVIIALAVIFIPMIFDDSNRSQNQSISIKIPDEPTDLKHKTLNIDSQSQTSSEKKQVEDNSQTQNLEIAAPIKTQESIIDVVDNTKTSKSPKQVPKAETKKTNKPLETVKKETEKEHSKPIVNLNTKLTDSKTENNLEQKLSYRVKLGSFSSQKNAQQLKAKILNKGFQAFVEKDNTTGLYKVFSNQVNSKIQAEEMNAKIQKLNLSIGKTSVEELTGDAQDKAELQLDSGWILQIGSFSSKENSLKLRDKIRKNGFVSFVDETFNPKKQLRYRVRIGPYATREEAITEQNKIKKIMNLKSLIKPHEKQRVIN